MRSFYRQRMMVGGDFAVVTAVPVFCDEAGRNPYERRRRPRYKPTSEAQAWANKKRAEDYFFCLMHANFGLEDYRLDLDFMDECLPQNEEELKRMMRNFIVRLRRRYQKYGVEMKLVWIAEFSPGGRRHIHGFLSGGVPVQEIQEAWNLGRANCLFFKYEKKGFSGYVHYVFKGSLLSKKWCATKNLKKPKERKADSVLRRKDVAAIRCGDLKALEERLKGWEVIEAREEWDEPSVFNWSAVEATVRDNVINGMPYLYIRLCRKGAKLSY